MAEELTPPKDDDNLGNRDAEGNAKDEKKLRRRSGNDEQSLRQGTGVSGRGKAKLRSKDAPEVASEGRDEVLRELAKACKRQGNFLLACKKYTQVLWRTTAVKFTQSVAYIVCMRAY